ncbi:MAG: hypothetical protein ACLFUQ_00015 [Candidatus Izemoplasmataceae bacterium]
MFNPIVLADSFLSDIPVVGMILDFLEGIIPMQRGIDYAYNYVSDFSYPEQLVWGIVFVIIMISGLIGLVKFLSKLIIIAAILFGVWLLYNQGVFG